MEKGDTPSIDFENGTVTHEGNEYHFLDFPKGIFGVLEESGLFPHMRKKLCKARYCNSCLSSFRLDRFQLPVNLGHISIPDY